MKPPELTEKPTGKQIKKFVEYVKWVSLFLAVKQGEEPPDKDLVAVMKWLEEQGND